MEQKIITFPLEAGIIKTTDRSWFKKLQGNRDILSPKYKAHLNQLGDSIVDYGWTDSEFLADQNGFLIDGQSRDHALTILGLNPLVRVRIIITEDRKESISTASRMNSTQKKWQHGDYENAWINGDVDNSEDYRLKKSFSDSYGYLIPHKQAVALLRFNQIELPTGSDALNEYKADIFQAKYFDNAILFAQHVRDVLCDADGKKTIQGQTYQFLAPYFKLYSHAKYNHKKFLAKLKIKGGVQSQVTSLKYKDHLRSLYFTKHETPFF